MTTVFLSYSTEDFFFAELASNVLQSDGIHVWRDQGQLRAGADWRHGIERGIAESDAVIVALSSRAAASPYVTFEWAYAMGKGKPVIPLKLGDCTIHPKLEPIQYLDFSYSRALPWKELIDRIKEVETESQQGGQKQKEGDQPPKHALGADPVVEAILTYLNQRGYQMASFERLRGRIDPAITNEQFKAIVRDNPRVFRLASLKGGKPGLAKLVP